MKKNLAFTFLFALLLVGFSNGYELFASPKPETCLETVENGAMEFALPQSNNDAEFLPTIANSKLLKKEKQVLIYEVEVFLQYSDGAGTDEFPSEFYLITAKGNEKNCKIKEIKSK